MAMRSILLSFVVICCFFSSCKNDEISAMQMSLELNNINDSLAYYGTTWGNEFKRAYATADFSGLYPIRTKMEQYVDKNINKVLVLEDVGGSEAFREQELKYLRFEKDIISSHFTRFEFFNDLTPPQDMERALNDLMAASAQEQAILEELHTKVMEYAEKNGL
jgi:hypothetical protein